MWSRNCCLANIRLANWRHNISENRCCTYIIDARSFNWIFLRLFIYVMVVSATVRYGTSMSHISLPQTSVSVDSWVVKEKSKNYHNWTSSASYDVCTPAFLIYAVWLWLNLQKMNVWLNPVSSPWFNWIFSITLCRNTDKYKLQAVLHTMWNALEVQSCWLLDFSFAPS